MLRPLRFVVIVTICLFALMQTSTGCTVLKVKNQSDFDVLQEKLINTIKAGEKNIYITLSSGTYTFNENHISLKGIDASDIKIHINSKGAILIPQGREYHDGEVYQGAFTVDNSWMSGSKDLETWSSVRYADGLVEILNVDEKKCRLTCKNAFPSNIDFSNAYILIPHWYQSSVYKVDKIDGKYIYFTVDDLKESSFGGYNVNDDYNYGKKEVRYKLCNVETGDDYLRITNGKVHLPKDITAVWEGKTHRFLTIQNCTLSTIELKGIDFRGNAFAESNPAIYFKNTECKEIRIHKCSFYGMRGNVISIAATPNVKIDNNKFEECYYYGVQSDNACANTVVEKNCFESIGKRMNNTFCVVCRGTDYYVSDNTFLNFGYGGIGTGVWYKSKMKQPCSGVIENNELSFDQNYIDNIDNYGIMDGGAIYLWTKNAGSVIRYNDIQGFSGKQSNRGIFCDDGAYNFEIYGNVITGIANSHCFDSRRMANVESSKTPESDIDKANVNIVIRDNIVDGGIRFEAHEEAGNGCVKGANYILLSKDGRMPENVISNVADIEDDIVLEFNGMKKGKIGLSPASYRQIKRTVIWRSVRQRVIKNRVSEYN